MAETILTQLVGPGKKFATIEDLAKGKLESDAFIEQVKGENKELRDLVTETGTKHDKLVSEVEFLKTLNGNKGTPPNPNAKAPDTKQEQGLSAEDVSKLIDDRDRKSREDANEAQVDSVLTKQFGAERTKAVADKAAELGMTAEQLKGLARTNPTAFYRLVNINPSGSPTGSMPGLKGGSHSPAGPSGDTVVRGAKWWEAKRAEIGHYKFALNRNLNLQMYNDMKDETAWDAN